MINKFVLCGGIAALALAVACSESSRSPSSPGASPAGSLGANADGSTLKAGAPSVVAPTGGATVDDASIALVVGNARLTYVEGVTPTYRFEIYNAAGARVYEAAGVAQGTSSTSHLVTAQLDPGTYRWQARAEYGGNAGPYSPQGQFVIEARTTGHILGNELYDPLINGQTVGTIHGNVTFIPGVGARLGDQSSYISYELPQTLTEGEFSLLVTGMPANTDGDKTKLFAMGEGYSDIVVNDRRMTVEKRGDPAGIIAWRFITSDDQIDTEGPERVAYNFQAHLTYFWEATWRNGFFNLRVKEGGTNGVTVYDMGKHYAGAYDPNPHVIYIGAPTGRSGPTGASVDGAIIRQVWVSPNPRPAYANK